MVAADAHAGPSCPQDLMSSNSDSDWDGDSFLFSLYLPTTWAWWTSAYSPIFGPWASPLLPVPGYLGVRPGGEWAQKEKMHKSPQIGVAVSRGWDPGSGAGPEHFAAALVTLATYSALKPRPTRPVAFTSSPDTLENPGG